MRFSTNPGDMLDDKVSTPRGLAIKLIGVEGARLPGSPECRPGLRRAGRTDWKDCGPEREPGRLAW